MGGSQGWKTVASPSRFFFAVIVLIAACWFGYVQINSLPKDHAHSKDELLSLSEQAVVDGSDAKDVDLAIPSTEDIVKKIAGSFIKQATEPKSVELSKSLDFHLADTTALLAKLDDAGQDQIALINSQLESKQAELLTIEEEVSSWLIDKDLVNSKLEKQIQERFLTVKTALEHVVSVSTVVERQQAVADAKALLSKLTSSKIKVLAQSGPGFTLDTPTLRKPSDYPKGLPPAYEANQDHPSSPGLILPEPSSPLDFVPRTDVDLNVNLMDKLGDYVADGLLTSMGISDAFAAPPLIPSEAQSCGHVPADVGSALPEVNITDSEIEALAEKLDYSAIKIYSYVRNNIKFHPYAGSVKGATATLKSGEGNAYDQASLLIALFRASNIPSRYVTGQIIVRDDAQAANWLGVKTKYSASHRLNQGQTAAILFGSDADLSFIHVWVEACVPYDNYRGSANNNSGFHWVPLDPSFKEMEYTDGTTVSDLPSFSFDHNTYLTTRSTTMPEEALLNQMEQAFGGALDHGGGYKGVIVQKEFDILPSTLPYEVHQYVGWNGVETASETAALPSTHRAKATFTLTNVGDQQFFTPITLDLPELVSKRMTLSFVGETASDQTNINTWLNASGGEAPCSVTNVVPVVKLEGAVVSGAAQRSVGLCSQDNKLDISVWLNDGVLAVMNEMSFDDIGAHNFHSLVVSAFQSSDQWIEERANKLLEKVGETANPNDLHDETLGEYLNVVGLRYFNYFDDGIEVIGGMYGETGDAGHHIGNVSTAMKVSYLFDLPFAVSGEGLLINVNAKIRKIDIDNNTDSPASNYEAFRLGVLMASAYEAYVWQEHAQMDAVSTTRGIQYANETGLAVVELQNAVDVDNLLNQSCPALPLDLSYSESTKSHLRDLLNTGYSKITLPTCLIDYDNWAGAVWLAESNQVVDGNTEYGIFAAISGDYTAEGGHTLGSGSFPYGYDPFLHTGQFAPPGYDYSTFSFTRDPEIFVSSDIPEFDPGFGSYTGSQHGFTTFAGDPVNLVSGNMYHPERDIVIKGRGGLDFVFERTYNSHVRKNGPLGFGWTHSFNHYLVFMDGNGDGQTNKVVWMNGTGATNSFSVAGLTTGVSPGSTLTSFSEELEVIAQRESNGEYTIREKNGLTYYFENTAGLLDETAKLIRVTDRNGNSNYFAYMGENLATVTDDLNRTLTFHYDNANQHITRVVDWTGRTYRYTYTNNNLTSFETPRAVAGQETPTSYTYYTAADGTNLDRAMKSFVRPNGDSMTFEYYTNGKVFRHIDSLGQTHTFRYNRFRRETTAVNEKGISQTYLFNEYGQQLQHIQGDGSRRIYQYTDVNNPRLETVVRQELGYETLHAYDAVGNLIRTTQPDGSFIEYSGFSTLDQHCTVKDTNDNYTLYRYDAAGNRTETFVLKAGVVPTGMDCSYVPASNDIKSWGINEYDSFGNLTISKTVRDFTTQAGPYIEYVYDSDGLNPVTVRRCGLQQNGSITTVDRCVTGSQSFDELGRLTQRVNGNFYIDAIEYDENGAVSRATDATRQWRGYDYDDNGNRTAEHLLALDGSGRTAFYLHNTTEYDSLNRPVHQRNIAGHRTETVYDEIGNVLKITNPDGYSVHFEYDGLNRPTRAYDEHGRAVHTQYDIGGRPLSVTDANGNTTSYQYYGASENGQLRLTTTADNRTLEYFYDNAGNVVRTVDNIGRENLTEYDALNRPVRTVGPVHDSHGLNSIRQVTVTTYTNLGFIEKIEAGYTTNITGALGADVLSIQASYTYDDFGRLITEIDANNKVTQNIYDDHGNLTSTQKANGHIVTFDYDHARNGLLTTKTARLNASDPNPHITTYQYNPLGQLTLVTAPEVSYNYGYDEAQRLNSVTDSRGDKALNYDFSPGGQLNHIVDSEGKRSDFLYDATSRLTAILAPNGERVNFLFDVGGRLRETRMANGVSAKYSYDAGNKLLHLINETRDPADATQKVIISQHDYGYDTVGRRTSHIERIANTTTSYVYHYDNLDRMSSVYQNGGTSLVERYSYDEFNNRRTRQPNGSVALHYIYDDAQQLNQIRSGSDTGTLVASFVYDDSGNMTSKSEGSVSRTLVYDAQERIVQVSGSNISTENYQYDHEGRRIEKISGTTTNRYVYSGLSMWSEYGSSWNAALAHYTYTGLDKRIIRSTATDARYYHNDGLGSVVAVSNASGVSQASTRFDAWGNVIASTGSTQFGFTGREKDATGLHYYRARYYDSTMGRFTQRDPIGFGGGLNPYSYVSNSPQNFTDPLGLVQAPVTALGQWESSSFAGIASSIVNESYKYDSDGFLKKKYWDEEIARSYKVAEVGNSSWRGGELPQRYASDVYPWGVSHANNYVEGFNAPYGCHPSRCFSEGLGNAVDAIPFVGRANIGANAVTYGFDFMADVDTAGIDDQELDRLGRQGARLVEDLTGIGYDPFTGKGTTIGLEMDVRSSNPWDSFRDTLDQVGNWWAPSTGQMGHGLFERP